jgi:hypothetical protein
MVSNTISVRDTHTMSNFETRTSKNCVDWKSDAYAGVGMTLPAASWERQLQRIGSLKRALASFPVYTFWMAKIAKIAF